MNANRVPLTLLPVLVVAADAGRSFLMLRNESNTVFVDVFFGVAHAGASPDSTLSPGETWTIDRGEIGDSVYAAGVGSSTADFIVLTA